VKSGFIDKYQSDHVKEWAMTVNVLH